jgi:hypothetical protein
MGGSRVRNAQPLTSRLEREKSLGSADSSPLAVMLSHSARLSRRRDRSRLRASTLLSVSWSSPCATQFAHGKRRYT